jgi:hypothetical protein
MKKILTLVGLLLICSAHAQVETAWIKPIEAVASGSTIMKETVGKAELSIDGNKLTAWVNKGQSMIRFDLGRMVNIRGIKIEFRGNVTGKWAASVDVEKKNVLNVDQINGTHFFPPTYGRFIRIKSTAQPSTNPDHWCEIGECSVYIETDSDGNNKPTNPKLSLAKAIHLSFKTEKAVAYQVQASKDLKQWNDFRSQIMGNGGDYEIFFKVDDFTGMYYRVIAL